MKQLHQLPLHIQDGEQIEILFLQMGKFNLHRAYFPVPIMLNVFLKKKKPNLLL